MAQTSSPQPGAARVAILTLGCDKNTVDNEYLAGLLADAGCEVLPAEGANGAELDAAVVTTCGFIESARAQSLGSIAELARLKRETGSPKRLYVAGCLAQSMGDRIAEETPEVDGVVGVGQFRELAGMIRRDFEQAEAEANGAGRTVSIAPTPIVDVDEHLRRVPLGESVYAFLKIADGCNHTCSFCAIPSMKGLLRSVEPEILLAEARALLDRGVKEINLVAQDLSDYGRDRWRDYRLPELLRDLAALEGEFWIRCLYYYPGNVTDRFLEVVASEPKIVPYLEMPLQHLDPGVLRAMRRPFHEVNTFDAIKRIRRAVPGIAIRTTFIVGFPGETTAAYNNLLAGVRQLQFDRMGAFQYSPEAGTPAAEMSDPVTEKTMTQRWRMLMDRQAKISARLTKKRKKRRERVLVERFDADTAQWVARSTRDAPEVDARVYIADAPGLAVGQFADVIVKATETYDVWAEVAPPE